MVSYGTNITSVAAGRALTAAVAAIENDFGECMEVCKRENARSDDGIHIAHTRTRTNPSFPYLLHCIHAQRDSKLTQQAILSN